MKTKQSTNGLLYFREHLSCENYMTDTSTGFKYIKFDEGTSIEEEYAHKNYLLFFLKVISSCIVINTVIIDFIAMRW